MVKKLNAYLQKVETYFRGMQRRASIQEVLQVATELEGPSPRKYQTVFLKCADGEGVSCVSNECQIVHVFFQFERVVGC